MTQEEKNLLLKDISARIPYNVFVNINGIECVLQPHDISDLTKCDKDIKPYLFPLSSMTKEQYKEMQDIVGNPNDACIMNKVLGLELWLNSIDTDPTIWLDTLFQVQDWLNKNHFDYHNLINKNLAIDCTNLNIY